MTGGTHRGFGDFGRSDGDNAVYLTGTSIERGITGIAVDRIGIGIDCKNRVSRRFERFIDHVAIFVRVTRHARNGEAFLIENVFYQRVFRHSNITLFRFEF